MSVRMLPTEICNLPHLAEQHGFLPEPLDPLILRELFAATARSKSTSAWVYASRAKNDTLDIISKCNIVLRMKTKHAKTLGLIFCHPVSGNIRWQDVEALLSALGAEFVEAEGSRVRIFLFNEMRVFHRPHPSPTTEKGAVAALRNWLEANGVTP